MTIIDISRTLSPSLALWPGSEPFEIHTALRKRDGASVNLSNLAFNAHTGSHADAPYHFDDAGVTLEQVDLRPFWGLAQVVTVHKSSGPLFPADFAGYDLSRAPRLLVRTPLNVLPQEQFPDAIPHPSPELADYLGSQGIILYGTDAPSMDAMDSQDLPGHHAMLRNQIAILEGLYLTEVSDGLYELTALPLKIAGGDGSPVRAALKTVNR
jgi:arylformamidase